MNRRCKPPLTTAAMALAAAFAASTAFAVAPSGNYPMNQDPSASSDTYSSNTTVTAPDQAIDSRAPQSSNADEAMSDSDQSNEANDNSTATSDEEASNSQLNSEAPVYDATRVSERGTATGEPVLVLPDEPRYTPETGDAQYGSKIAPYTYGPSANRFNDAKGQ